LISEDELHLLQQEALKMLDFLEQLMTTGENHSGARYILYYTPWYLDSSCVHYKYDSKMMSQIWIYPENPIIIHNNQFMCETQKKWLDAKIKYATLITKSNDMLQAEFVNTIREKIMKMGQVD
jgi:hypothetical protein